MSDIAKTSELNFQVGLDADNIPVDIQWSAQENGKGQIQSAKGMLISLFDRDSRDTFKIDLWTKDMQVGEMDRFMYHTLRALGDTYYKATQNEGLANEFQRFVQFFGEKTEVIPPPSAQSGQ